MWLITITNLLAINLILTLIHESGFIENIDIIINKKYPFYHLPYPVKCLLCGTWWCSLLYIIIAGPFNLIAILLCLVNAHLTKITQPLFRLVENILLKGILQINKWFNL